MTAARPDQPSEMGDPRVLARGSRIPAGLLASLVAASVLLLSPPPVVADGTAAPALGSSGVHHDPAAPWRSVPLFGGEIHSLVFSPRDPQVALAGTAAGQVYLSSDGGASWSHAGRVFALPGWVVASLQFDPNRPARVWAALRGVWGGGCVVRSDDLGTTWQVRAQLADDEIFALALVPGEEDRLLLGTRKGVLGSSDGGESWRLLSAEQPGLVEVSSLLVAPHRPQTVLAGTFRRAFRSDDGGATWRGVFEGMVLDSQVFSLVTRPGRSAEVWASTCGWVYRSEDLGERWARFKGGLAERRTPSLGVLPGGRLLAGTIGGVFVSDDDGASWQRRTRDDLSVLAIAYHPRHPEVVLIGTEGSGVWRSRDGGETFAPANRGIVSPRVSALAGGGSELLAAVAHGGPASGLYASTDGGRRFLHQLAQIPTVLALAVSGGEAWAGTEQGLWARVDGVWEQVGEVAAGRVETVSTRGGRVEAAGPLGTWAREAGRFVPAPRAPASDATELPAGSGRAARTRLLSTGDAVYPLAVVRDERLALRAGADGRLHSVALPFPARDVLAVAVHGGKLFLGTSGFGLLYADLAALVPPAEGPPSATAVAGGG